MRSSRSGIILRLVPVALFCALPAEAGSIRFDLRFAGYDLSVSDYAGGEFPACPGGLTWFDEGMPNLPVVTSTFVIPQGMSVTDAEVEIIAEETLEGFHDILPVRVVPFGEEPGPFLRDPAIYISDARFPDSPVVGTGTGTRTGFQLGSVSVSPFSYNPLSGRLSVITEARITLMYSSDPSVERLSLTAGQIGHAESMLGHIVANPGDLAACRPGERETDDSWPVWVAIGPASMEATLQPLVDHRNSTGLQAAYVPLDSIYATYTGFEVVAFDYGAPGAEKRKKLAEG